MADCFPFIETAEASSTLAGIRDFPTNPIAAIDKSDIAASMDLLSAMRVYVRVVEAGSVSAAARTLGMGQPTVSERIARLEDYLQEQLLVRTTRSLRPTQTGLMFFERAKTAIAAAERAEDVTLRNKDALSGTIRLAAPHWIGEMVLPQILMRFRKKHPRVNVELNVDDRIINPVTADVDVSLRLGNAPAENCHDEHFGVVQRVLAASPEYLAEYGTPRSPDELIAHSFIMVSGIYDNGSLPLRRGETEVAADINIAWAVGHWRPRMALLLSGAGIGILQVPVGAEALSSGQLTRILPDYQAPGFPLRLLYPKRDPAGEISRHLVDFLRVELRSYAQYALAPRHW